MNHRRDEYRAALTDFSLEGVPHAKQYMAVLAFRSYLLIAFLKTCISSSCMVFALFPHCALK